MKITYSIPCNIAQTLNLIGDRWSLLILHRLLIGKGTYSELQQSLEGIPSNLLSKRLKSLEEYGLVSSELYQAHPPRYQYSLTQSGIELEDIFNSIILWGQKNLTTCYRRLVHSECGHGIELKYYCNHCGRMVATDELENREVKEND